MQRYQDGLGGLSATVFSDLQSWSTTQGQLAGFHGSNGAGKVVTVFAREFTSSRAVRWHAHRKDDTQLGVGAAVVPSAPNTHQWRPDIGGGRQTSDTSIGLVVYQREDGATFANQDDSEVWALRVDFAASTHGVPVGPAFRLSLGGARDSERPRVNQTGVGLASSSWIVVWQDYLNTGPWRVLGKRVAVANGSDSGVAVLAGSSSVHFLTPAIAGLNGRYMLAFGSLPPQPSKPETDSVRAVRVKSIDWLHDTSYGFGQVAEGQFDVNSADSLRVDSIAYDSGSGTHWTVAHSDTESGQEELRLTKIGYDAKAVESMSPNSGVLNSACALSFDDDDRRYVAAFAVQNGTSSNPLFAAHVVYDAVAPAVRYGNGCSFTLTAFHSYSGPQTVGSDTNRFALYTIGGRPALWAASLAQSSLPLDSLGLTGCVLAVDPGPSLLGTVLRVTDNNGYADVVLPVPSQLAPFTIHGQWLVLEPSANPGGIALTDGIRVEFGR